MEIIDETLNNFITEVLKDSIASEIGIEPGDELLKINNQTIKDIIDYKYLISDENLIIEIKKPNGEIWEYDIEKDFDEDLGIVFRNSLIDRAKSCQNKCIFCFIDQLPQNMRETLYFKDDDSRLSFLQGNFITLTNMSDEEIDRIIKYHLSPINVSVHTTNPDLRIKMLKNKNAGNIMEILKKFSETNIEINCQIVLVPGINDGIELEKTLADLGNLYPNVNSIACVPVGLTKYRDNLFKIKQFNKEEAKNVIDIINKYQKIYHSRFGTRLVFAADEFYCLSEIDLPDYEEYEDFPQYENGVGMIRSFLTEVTESLDGLEVFNYQAVIDVGIATGTSAYPYIELISSMIKNKFKNINLNVIKVDNKFFGETITVSGLITGQDLIDAVSLNNKSKINLLLIPENMLRKGDDIFLDDYRIEDVEKALGIKVIPLEINGNKLIEFFKKGVFK
ncbi:MAG: DUF512 domain-containing protein [Tissierellales bacterium]|nr:DUF512 domain-containing protein [Tissierellales bacterium]